MHAIQWKKQRAIGDRLRNHIFTVLQAYRESIRYWILQKRALSMSILAWLETDATQWIVCSERFSHTGIIPTPTIPHSGHFFEAGQGWNFNSKKYHLNQCITTVGNKSCNAIFLSFFGTETFAFKRSSLTHWKKNQNKKYEKCKINFYLNSVSNFYRYWGI